MFSISDGREEFYQWDIDRRVIVDDETVNEVHFCNKTDDCSLVCAVCEEDGIRYANVPNVLLQDTWDLNIYGYDINYTKHSARFAVLPRTKPSDYVYSETEILTYHSLEKRLDEIEENGVSDEQVEKAISGYLEENPIEIPEPDLTGYATEPYVWTAVGELEEAINTELKEYAKLTDIPDIPDVPDIDLEGYATEQYVQDYITNLDSTCFGEGCEIGAEGSAMGAEIFNAYGKRDSSDGAYHTNVASKRYAHAEGMDTKAQGMAAHAEGRDTEANEAYSHAEGWGCKIPAGATAAHAEGMNSKAWGDYSHAEGLEVLASGQCSHAEGGYTIAASDYQHVQGKYNKEESSEKYAHIVGNGDSSNRSNCHTLDWNGNAWFSGKVYVGGTSMSDATELGSGSGSVDLSNYYTKSEVYPKSQVYTKTEVDTAITNAKPDLTDYYTKSEVDAEITKSQTDLSDYYTKSQVDTAITNAKPDLTGYYTKEEIDALIPASGEEVSY